MSETFLLELAAKHIFQAGDVSQKQLAERCALHWEIIEHLLAKLRDGACIHSRPGQRGELRISPTEKGRTLAMESLAKCAYIGPAPVPLALFQRVTAAQSVRRMTVTPADMEQAFGDVVIAPKMLHRLGPAVISGQAIIFYGPAGTGKTFIAQRIRRLMRGDILVPHTIMVAGNIIKYFDPRVHKPVKEDHEDASLLAQHTHDPRFVRCQRPAVITGGELTLDMLELGYDDATKIYQAPMHMKANNGVFVVDDLGRQRARPEDILNRWIIPLEEKRDFMTLKTGGSFEVPMDMVLIFSTNLAPQELADEAFLRRLGYKLQFGPMLRTEYESVWRQACSALGMEHAHEVFEHTVDRLHTQHKMPLLPCHPRDLIGKVADQCRYHGTTPRLTKEGIEDAWRTYFGT